MTSSWVVDASPLILLANVGCEHLFTQLADDVIVPQAVAREVRAGPKNDRARQLVTRRFWRTVSTPPPPASLLAWDLGAGETAVISYTLANPGWTAILDTPPHGDAPRSSTYRSRGLWRSSCWRNSVS